MRRHRVQRYRVHHERRRCDREKQRPSRRRAAGPEPAGDSPNRGKSGSTDQRIQQPRRSQPDERREQKREAGPVSGNQAAVGGRFDEPTKRRNQALHQLRGHLGDQRAAREDTRLEHGRILIHRERMAAIDEHGAHGQRCRCANDERPRIPRHRHDEQSLREPLPRDPGRRGSEDDYPAQPGSVRFVAQEQVFERRRPRGSPSSVIAPSMRTSRVMPRASPPSAAVTRLARPPLRSESLP